MARVIGNIMVQKRGIVSLGLLKEHMPLNDGDIFQVEAEQAWFWTKEWQEGEIEAGEDKAAGRIKSFESVESLLEDLDK
ncbi:MAG TPA: AbrB family transcriptional regulator [Desulfotomaculum sp.]|nr:AbrB family transcriptional regulator [Desulfotomaculum sp.]